MGNLLARRHLDEQLTPLRGVLVDAAPSSGWLRTIRDALGMSLSDLARRMGVSKGAVAQAERAELDGSITLRRLRSVADALDCDVAFVLLPRTSLQEVVERQAAEVITRRLKRAGYHMELEGQGVPSDRLALLVREQVADLLAKGGAPWE